MTRAGVFFVGLLTGASACISLDALTDGSADGAASDAATSDASNGGDGASGDGASGDAGTVFLDNFDRPNAALIGNGWIEKHSPAFTLGNGVVTRATLDSFDYSDDIVYRPAVEDIADSELSVEFVFPIAVDGFPQLHSRIQESTVGVAGALDSYLFYINGSATTATISRTAGAANLTVLTNATLSPALVPGTRYRLRFRVTGTNPVALDGIVEQQAATWQSIGEATALDSAASRLQSGSVGFSAGVHDTGSYLYDNFMRTPL